MDNTKSLQKQVRNTDSLQNVLHYIIFFAHVQHQEELQNNLLHLQLAKSDLHEVNNLQVSKEQFLA